MNSNFRTGLRNGDVLIGTLITMPVAEVAEIMIEVGLVSDVPPAGGSVGNSKTAST